MLNISRANTDAPPVAYQKLYFYDGSNNLIYECWAAPGTASSDAAWAIRKYTYDGSNNRLTETWAGGGSLETHVADNHASLSYS